LPAGQTASAPLTKQDQGPTRSGPSRAATAPVPLPNSPTSLSNAQTSNRGENVLPNHVTAHPVYPGIPRIHTEGGSR
jgi:hypothetical protein